MQEYDHLSTTDLLGTALAEAHRDSSDDNDELYWRVIALADRATREVFDAAAAWCRTGSATQKEVGANVLSRFRGASTTETPFGPSILSQDRNTGAATEQYRLEAFQVLRPLLADYRPSVVVAAIRALDESEDDSRGIIQHWDHPATEVRLAVAQALPCAEDCPDEVETLIRLSGDEDSSVRDWATFGLGTKCQVDSPRIRNALLVRLGDSDRETRSEAITGLAERGDRRVLGPLIAELYCNEVFDLSIEAAEELGAPELLPALTGVRQDFGPSELLDQAIRKCGGDPAET